MQRLADNWLARCLVGAFFRRRARRRLVEIDHHDAARTQTRLLRGLVHRARATRCGLDHDFGRIRTPADYRRLVPLRTPLRLWQEYGQLHFPELQNVLCPEPVLHLLPVGDAPGEALPFVPLTPGLLDSYRCAALTALALAGPAVPGRILSVGGGAAPLAMADGSPAGSLEEVVLRTAPLLLRPRLGWSPLAFGGPALTDDSCRLPPEAAVRQPVSCLIGTAGRLQRFLELGRRLTGRQRVREIWPQLTTVLYGLDTSGVTGRELAALLGSDAVRLLRYCPRPEGILAVEDPRCGRLRLLTDHGLYYEFVPVEELYAAAPGRRSVAEVEAGAPYALAVTSPAGAWACLTGLTVRFACRQPLLLERIEAAAPESPRSRTEAPALSLPPPRPGTVGIPAAHPETPFHTPWSAPADRG